MGSELLVALYSPFPQSGKSTFASFLTEYLPNSKIISFADPMREALVPWVGELMSGGEGEVLEWLSDERKDSALIPRIGVTLRHMLRTLGTEYGRKHVHPDLWVYIAQERIRKALSSGRSVIVDDLRMENEYALLKRKGAMMVKIVKPGSRDVEHESDAALEALPFDKVVMNDGTVEDLQMKAMALGRWGGGA